MSDVDRYYGEKYLLPLCPECGEDYLTCNAYKIYKVELFCANDQCPAFVKTFWVDKTELKLK